MHHSDMVHWCTILYNDVTRCEAGCNDIIIIIIKRGWQCKAGKEQLTPYQSEDPNPTTPTHRKKEEKGKTVGDKKRASS